MRYEVDRDSFLRVLQNAESTPTYPLRLEFCEDELLVEMHIRRSLPKVVNGVRTSACDGHVFDMRFCTSIRCLETGDLHREAFSSDDEEGAGDDDIITFYFTLGSRDKVGKLSAEAAKRSQIILDINFQEDKTTLSIEGCKTVLDLQHSQVFAEGDSSYIGTPRDFPQSLNEHEVSWKEDNPSCVCFPLHSAEGYWGITELPSPGNVEGLNAVRTFIDRDKAQIITGESFMDAPTGSARRGRSLPPPTPVTPVANPQVQLPPTTPSAPQDGACGACGGTGKNSKGGQCAPCVYAGRIPDAASVATAPPPAAPQALPTPPAAPVIPPAPPQAAQEPPLQKKGESTDAPEAGKKRRTKEELRADRVQESIAVIQQELAAEDSPKDPLIQLGLDILTGYSAEQQVVDACMSILRDLGYTVVAKNNQIGPDTMESNLDRLLLQADTFKDTLKHIKAMSSGLYTKEQLLRKLADL